jgi:YggT family protein
MIYETINLIFNIYRMLLMARIFLSWLPHNRYQYLISLIYDLTDPYLDIFRSLHLNFGGFDLSPLIAFFVLGFIQNLILQILFI